MSFADLLAGEDTFLDANVFAYHFTQDPLYGTACTQLLDRIQRQEVWGYTSTHVLGELAHRMMTLEAVTGHGLPQANIARRLKRNPTDIQKLVRFRQVIDELLRPPLQVLSIPAYLLGTAAALSQQFGLLTNDALIVAVMQENRLTRLASTDADFDRVPGITRYGPA